MKYEEISKAFASKEEGIVYSSLTANNIAEQKALYKIINTDEKLADMINREIDIKDLFIENVSIVDDDTNEVAIQKRAIVVAKDGKAYSAVSSGLINSLLKMIRIFGAPTWNDEMRVMVKQVKTKRGRNTFTLEVI